ncbi:MAG: hypothetical protein H6999_07590 [Hahellaceae bacterium]|nr:hypothetical protein [Hahellaceae bacterium]
MKKILAILAIASLSGCSVVALNSANTADLNKVDFKKSFRTGEACESTFLIFGPFGSSSVVDAAKSGKLSKVDVVEQKSTNYFIASKRCTIVHGE